MFPEWLILLMLTILLFVIARQTTKKGLRLWHSENEKKAKTVVQVEPDSGV
jgi:hypothetical protein